MEVTQTPLPLPFQHNSNDFTLLLSLMIWENGTGIRTNYSKTTILFRTIFVLVAPNVAPLEPLVACEGRQKVHLTSKYDQMVLSILQTTL
jgi:hypothetical protein